MSDDQRVYSDKEFAHILREAAELANQVALSAPSSDGLTLTEIKEVAVQVGLDPILVEKAAKLLDVRVNTSLLERFIGGPLRYDHTVRFPITLDEHRATRLLSAVRISAGQYSSREAGNSGSTGMTWHDGDEGEALSVTARVEEESTSVSVILNRHGTLVTVMTFVLMAMFLACFAGVVLYGAAPVLAIGASITGMCGAVLVARSYWASSTRKVRERVNAVMNAIGHTLTQPETTPPNEPGDSTHAIEASASWPTR